MSKLCSPTCLQFTTMAYLYSANHPKAPTFRFATFGGTGDRRDSHVNSFPGGFVLKDDSLSSLWTYYGLQYVTARWLGNQTILDEIDASLGPVMPSFPAYR